MKDLVPRIKDLRKGELYKVLQITINGEPQLFFEETSILHSEILRRVLRIFGVSYKEIRVGYGFGPDTSGPQYMVAGMGGAVLLPRNRIRFFGDSFGYGLKISDAHLDWFREKYPDWEFIVESPLP